jgi:hypothetical protein
MSLSARLKPHNKTLSGRYGYTLSRLAQSRLMQRAIVSSAAVLHRCADHSPEIAHYVFSSFPCSTLKLGSQPRKGLRAVFIFILSRNVWYRNKRSHHDKKMHWFGYRGAKRLVLQLSCRQTKTFGSRFLSKNQFITQ